MVKKIKCNFPKIGSVYIYIKDKDLYNFTIRQFKNYIVEVLNTNDFNGFVFIEAINVKNISFQDEIILGREVKFGKNKIEFTKSSKTQKIRYNYDFKENINIKIYLRKNILYLVKQLIKSKYSLNHTLFYQTILYPIFSLYSMLDNYFLVHGSLLKINNNFIVLTGLDGVGKSSLSNELIKSGAKILADNFVLFNGNNFIGLNMPIRLDLENNTKECVIYRDNNLKEVLYPSCDFEEIKADKIYFLSISNKMSIKKLNDFSYQNWHLINNGAGEILDANLFNLPFYYKNILEQKIINNSKFEYYMFSIPKGKVKEAVKELLCQLNI